MSDTKFERFKILSCYLSGVGVFRGADYDGEKTFCINEPCDVILTEWGKFSSTCLFKILVKDMLVYESAAICPVCHMSCVPEHEVVGYIYIVEKTANL